MLPIAGDDEAAPSAGFAQLLDSIGNGVLDGGPAVRGLEIPSRHRRLHPALRDPAGSTADVTGDRSPRTSCRTSSTRPCATGTCEPTDAEELPQRRLRKD